MRREPADAGFASGSSGVAATSEPALGQFGFRSDGLLLLEVGDHYRAFAVGLAVDGVAHGAVGGDVGAEGVAEFGVPDPRLVFAAQRIYLLAVFKREREGRDAAFEVVGLVLEDVAIGAAQLISSRASSRARRP